MKHMSNKFKVIIMALAILATLLFVVSCDEGIPYESYDGDGYTASVKYDANGGTFTAGTSVIVDTYNLDKLPLKNGKRLAKLITPDDESRGKGNYFTPSKNGYIFVGWYAQITEETDNDGNKTYSYGNMWDFDDYLELDENTEYSAVTPALTLYAAWVPEFKFEFYSLETKELLGEYKVSPYTEIDVPIWETKTGKLKMYQFPTVKGKTFDGVYLDENGTLKVTDAKIKHMGSLNYENAEAVNPVMKLYIDSIEGEWQRIYNADQLGSISPSGNYVIMNDIDFADGYWPEFLTKGSFKGQLVAEENVVFSNITYSEPSGATNVGLFGQLLETAVLKNIRFENVKFEMKSGAPLTSGVNFGLLAGTINESATLENVSISGSIVISHNCSFKGDIYTIGLVCGVGSTDVDYSEITCVADNEGAIYSTIEVEVDGNSVVIVRTFIEQQ